MLCYAPYLDVDMELSKKTTILFSEALHRRLTELAELALPVSDPATMKAESVPLPDALLP
jgi:hypothetical protein